MRVCIGIEPGESLSAAEKLTQDLTASAVLPPGTVIDVAAFIDDNGPITMTVTPSGGGLDGPSAPAQGRNGRWERLGEVSVDGATLAITDPSGHPPQWSGLGGRELSFGRVGQYGTGVHFMAGFGDGGYHVWAWIIDTGEDGEVDERIAQIVLTLIDADGLEQWRS